MYVLEAIPTVFMSLLLSAYYWEDDFRYPRDGARGNSPLYNGAE